jgi:hypothetical protein
MQKNISKNITSSTLIIPSIITSRALHLLVSSSVVVITNLTRTTKKTLLTNINIFIIFFKKRLELLMTTVNVVATFSKQLTITRLISTTITVATSIVKMTRKAISTLTRISLTFFSWNHKNTSTILQFKYESSKDRYVARDGLYTCVVVKKVPSNVPVSRTGVKWFLYYDGQFIRSGSAASVKKAGSAMNNIITANRRMAKDYWLPRRQK